MRTLKRIPAFHVRSLISAALLTLGLALLPLGMVTAAGPGKTIPDQYIVVMKKDGNKQAAAQARQMVSAVGGGKILYVYERALRGFAAQLNAAQAAALQNNPNVERVEQDRVMQANAEQSAPPSWGLDRVDQAQLPLNNQYLYPDNAGQGVHIYIIDTGLNTGHVDFAGRVGSGENFVSSGRGRRATVDPADISDCNGHGTHVASTAAGTAYGVAKLATVHAVRVLDCNGSGSNSGVIAGVDFVANNFVAPAVANMSLGGGNSTALDDAVRNAIAAGVPFAVAAGNSNADACSGSPNRVTEAITVGSSTTADGKSSFSNFGACLDIWAPGSGITGAWYDSPSASATISGTSMASPHVAGAMALIAARGGSPNASQVGQALIEEASVGALAGSLGAGSPNLLLRVANGGGAPSDYAPVSSFSYNCTGLECQFDGSASHDDVGIDSYSWDFGDGSAVANGVSPAHVYAEVGAYDVTLTVTDTSAQSGSSTQTVVLGSGGSPCSECEHISGSLSGSGDSVAIDIGASNGGTFEGYLRGAAGTDFDLVLQKANKGGRWKTVAAAQSPDSSEDLVYNGGSAVYRWVVNSYSGSGAFEFYFKNP